VEENTADISEKYMIDRIYIYIRRCNSMKKNSLLSCLEAKCKVSESSGDPFGSSWKGSMNSFKAKKDSTPSRGVVSRWGIGQQYLVSSLTKLPLKIEAIASMGPWYSRGYIALDLQDQPNQLYPSRNNVAGAGRCQGQWVSGPEKAAVGGLTLKEV